MSFPLPDADAGMQLLQHLALGLDIPPWTQVGADGGFWVCLLCPAFAEGGLGGLEQLETSGQGELEPPGMQGCVNGSVGLRERGWGQDQAQPGQDPAVPWGT